MEKEDFGRYYNDIEIGNRSQFVMVVSIHTCGSYPSWRKKLTEWSKNIDCKEPISDLHRRCLEKLIQHDQWKDIYRKLEQAIDTFVC